MDANLKVTDQQQESAFADLVAGDAVLSIPLFQRPYRWGSKHLDWLWRDIVQVREETPSVFLGVIVCVNRGASPGRPIPWEIVDGQQRLSSLYLFMMAAVDVFARNDALIAAANIAGSYLLVRPLADNPINTKLVPSFADRAQFKKIWEQIIAIPGFTDQPSIAVNIPRPPPASGPETGPLLKQFTRMRANLQAVYKGSGQAAVQQMADIAATKLSVVCILLRDPLVAPKIFERLNARAELVTTADLVRNEVFAKAPASPMEAQQMFNDHWEPFADKFTGIENGLEKFLFPYGLIIRPTVQKADLFKTIREYWSGLNTPAAIVQSMTRYVSPFLALETGCALIPPSPNLDKYVNRIHRLNKPSSTYAFLIRLLVETQAGAVTVDECIAILRVIEDFLFRRAICAIEPTGLHAVFKSLWTDLTTTTNEAPAPGVTAVAVRRVISGKPTVKWPSNAEFVANIKTGNLYKKKVCGFALREHDLAAYGDTPADKPEAEHVLPQTPTDHWKEVFGDRYTKLVDTWANLIPLSTVMNPVVGQLPYAEKRSEYEHSMFSTARHFADDNETWTPETLDARASTISDWAITRWPTEQEAL